MVHGQPGPTWTSVLPPSPGLGLSIALRKKEESRNNRNLMEIQTHKKDLKAIR